MKITTLKKLMAKAFNDDGDYDGTQEKNARKKLLRRLDEGEKAIKKLSELTIVEYGDGTKVGLKGEKK